MYSINILSCWMLLEQYLQSLPLSISSALSTTRLFIYQKERQSLALRSFSPGSIRRNMRGHDAGGDKALNISQLLNYLHELFHFRGTPRAHLLPLLPGSGPFM